MTTDAKALVLEFCEAFGKGSTPTELVDYFADGAVYHNIPVEPAVGHEAILGLLNMFLTPVERVEFRVLNIVADGDTVLTERVDAFFLPNALEFAVGQFALRPRYPGGRRGPSLE